MPGHSGSFVLSQNGRDFKVYGTNDGKGLYTVEYDDSTSNNHHFTIKTGDGYSYLFGLGGENGHNNEQMWQREYVDPTVPSSKFMDGELKTVTWLLNRIIAPNGRTVDFVYDSKTTDNNVPQNNDDVLTSFCKKQNSGSGVLRYKEATLTFTSRLVRVAIDSIFGNTVKRHADFTWDRPTCKEVADTDLSGWTALVVPIRRLSGITVTEGDKCVRNVSLNYTMNGLRPLLTGVSVDSLGRYGMEYITDPNHPLPGLLTNGIDFWGYYNGKDTTGNTSIAPMVIDALTYDENRNASYMDPDSTFSRLGLLRTITYPTGGSTTVEYEANHAPQIVLRRRQRLVYGIQPEPPEIDSTSTPFLPSLNSMSRFLGYTECGGVRVSAITDYDGVGSPSRRTYSYEMGNGRSSGIVQNFPRFYASYEGGSPVYNPSLKYPGSGFDATHIAYSRVTEHFPNGSSRVTEFSDWGSDPDEYSSHSAPYDLLNGSQAYLAFLDNILREPDSRAYRRGIPTHRQMKDSTGRIVTDETWTLSDLGNDYAAYVLGSGQYWWSARRFLCDRRPSSYCLTEYPDDGGAPHITTIQYGYDCNDLLSSERMICDSLEKERVVVYSGSGEAVGDTAVLMRTEGVKSAPLEERIWSGDQLLSATRMDYSRIGDGHYAPRATYKAPVAPGTGSVAYGPRAETLCESFDTLGRPTVMSSRDGTPSTVYWDGFWKYPSAVFPGCKDETVQTTSQQTAQTTGTTNYTLPVTITKTFTSTAAGSFTATYTMADSTQTSYRLYFKMDNGTEKAVNCFMTPSGYVAVYDYFYSGSLPSGSHTLRIRFTKIKPPDDPILKGTKFDLGSTGTLTIRYATTQTVMTYTHEQNVLYESFSAEGTGGSDGVGIGGGRGCTGVFSREVHVHPGRKYVLDWLRKENGVWTYHCSRIVSSDGDTTLTVAGTSAAPIDNVRFYPEGTDAVSWTWNNPGDSGPASRTDARGITEFYEYDSCGRLKRTLDNCSRLVERYAYDYSPNSPGASKVTTVRSLASDGSLTRTASSFHDGLGRPYLNCRLGASGSGGNLAEWTEYDALGRQSRTWLPFVWTPQQGIPADTLALKAASAQTWQGDTLACVRTAYDGTPLDRVRATVGPGQAWHNADKGVTTTRLTSRSEGALAVRRLGVSLTGDTTMIVTGGWLYTAGELLAEEHEDADGAVDIVFTDALGRTVLERRKVSEGQWADTYRLYDAAGRLAAVLPPKLSDALESGTAWRNPTQAELDSLAFQYRYDNRGREIARKNPGAAWVYCIYDAGDRPVLTQDGNLRAEGKWRFRLEDAGGRECITGIAAGSWNAFASPLDDTKVTIAPSNDPLPYYGYSVEGLQLSSPEVLSVKWWNNYDFIGGRFGLPASSFAYHPSTAPTGYSTWYDTSAQGLMTGVLDRMITKGNIMPEIRKSIYYDWQGQPVQERSESHINAFDVTCFGYDFRGNMTGRYTVHSRTGQSQVVETTTFTYDPWDRPLVTTHKIGTGNTVTLSSKSYDSVGRIASDSRCGAPALNTIYNHNIRSWLTDISCGQGGGTFRERLYYESGRDGNSPAAPLWCGNVSRMDWSHGSMEPTRSYEFGYDALGRLSGASFSCSMIGWADNFSRSYSYDLNGNLTSGGLTYRGNALSAGTYDANGNQVSLGPVSTAYSRINQPLTVSVQDTVSLSYGYASNGDKLECYAVTRHAGGDSTVVVTDYVGDAIYRNGVLECLLFDGGYVDMTGTAPQYRFFVTDHLGSVRVVADQTGLPLRTNHYDPYGNEVLPYMAQGPGPAPSTAGTDALSRFMFCGKEFEPHTGLYDFGARRYSPATSTGSRWTAQDPLAGNYLQISPYVYCLDNPENSTDPDGNRVFLKGDNELRAVRNTLPIDASLFVQVDRNGFINESTLRKYRGNSKNSSSLLLLVSSDITITVSFSHYFYYLSNDSKTIGINDLFCIDDYLYDTRIECVSGLTTGECGNYGKTLFPDLEGIENSPSKNIEIYLSPSLSPLGAAEAFSHEAYGHALLYIISGKDHNKASHQSKKGREENEILKEMILSARKETVNNYIR